MGAKPIIIAMYLNETICYWHSSNIFQGAEFDPVKALGYASVSFRRALWVHVSFLARRRSRPVKPADEAAAAADDDSDVKRGRKRRSRNKRNRAPPESPDKQFFASYATTTTTLRPLWPAPSSVSHGSCYGFIEFHKLHLSCVGLVPNLCHSLLCRLSDVSC